MKPLPCNRDLLAVAPNVIWFETPQQALADPIRFLAYLMSYGTIEEGRGGAALGKPRPASVINPRAPDRCDGRFRRSVPYRSRDRPPVPWPTG